MPGRSASGEGCVEDQKSLKHHKMPPNYLLHMFSFCSYNLNMTVRWEEGGRLLANNDMAATHCVKKYQDSSLRSDSFVAIQGPTLRISVH